MNPSSGHRVIVIGAGASGLACACELRQRGYQVLVLEARSRPGGRLKSSRLQLQTSHTATTKNVFPGLKRAPTSGKDTDEQEEEMPGVYVDMGGALIHGIEDNPLATLVHDSLGLSTRKVQETLLMNDTGWPVDSKEDERVAQIFDETLEEAFRRAELTFSDDDGKRRRHERGAPNPMESFGSVLETVWKSRSVTEDVILRWYRANLEFSCGVGLEKLGLEWNEDEAYGFDGDHVALTGSWKPVVDALALGLDILYKSEVAKVQILHPQESRPSRRATAPPSRAAAPPSRAAAVQRSASPTRKKPRTEIKIVNSVINKTPEVIRSRSGVIPLRQSRRLRGVDGSDASLRRSVRSTKGKFENRYVVPDPPKTEEEDSENAAKKIKKASENLELPKEEAPRSGSIVLVTLENGKVLEADSVVCTLPLAILQQGKVTFDPPLIDEKQNAINSLGSGLLNKCALSFPSVFWPNSDFLGLADRSHSYLVLNIHRVTGEPVLVFLYGGSFAESIEDWDDQSIVADCLRVLQRICSVKQVPDPVDYHTTRWGKEQFSGMAFTYIPPGVPAKKNLKAMSQPVLDFAGKRPVLQFAGEHTTPFHPSTIHGAFLSGVREAYRLECAVDPEGVENLIFREDEIYQPTFSLAKGKKALVAVHDAAVASSAPEPQQLSSGSTRNRRSHRSAACVMKLRPRPTESPLSPSQTAQDPTQASPEATSRENRYRFGRLSKTTTLTSAASSSGDYQNGEDPRDLEALEDRILLRCLDSYGEDYEFIQQMALPIFGDDQDKTISQLRNRCRKLMQESKKAAPSKAARIRKAWFSPKEV